MKKLLTILLMLFTLTTGISADEKPIRVAALKGPTGLSMIYMIDENIQLGTKTEYSIVNTPQLALAGLLSGNIDIAALPTNLAAIIFNKKPDYVLGAVTGDGTLYVVSSRDDINNWSDLKDKTVYNIAKTSTPGFLFNHLLKENNLDPETDLNVDFKFNNVELAPMLIAGKVDTGVLPEPLVTKVLLNNKDMKVVLDFQKEYEAKSGSSYPLSCVVIKKSLLQEQPKAVANYLMELEKSVNKVKANPMDAGNRGKSHGLGVTGPLVKNAIDRINYNFMHAADAESALKDYYKVLFNSDPKSIGGALPKDEFYLGK